MSIKNRQDEQDRQDKYHIKNIKSSAPIRIRSDKKYYLHHPGKKSCATASGDDAEYDREIEFEWINKV